MDFIKTGYVEFCFGVIMNLYSIDWSNAGLSMSNVYMIATGLLIIFYPIWLYFFLRKNYHRLGDDEFSKKYDAGYAHID